MKKSTVHAPPAKDRRGMVVPWETKEKEKEEDKCLEPQAYVAKG